MMFCTNFFKLKMLKMIDILKRGAGDFDYQNAEYFED